MGILLFQDAPSWGQLAQYGPTVVLLGLVLFALVRVAPLWKEVKLKELEIRGDENSVRGQVAGALNHLADVIKDIAVEQRRHTEQVEILQRVNAHTADQLQASVNLVGQRLDRIEQRTSPVPLAGANAETHL